MESRGLNYSEVLVNFVNATHINRPFCDDQGRGGWLEVTPLPTPTVKGEEGNGKPIRRENS